MPSHIHQRLSNKRGWDLHSWWNYKNALEWLKFYIPLHDKEASSFRNNADSKKKMLVSKKKKKENHKRKYIYGKEYEVSIYE